MGASPSEKKSRMVMSEINVTPLVDVMLVLLIIFMVTAPLMQQGLDVNLPQTTSSGVSTTDEPFLILIKKNNKIYFGDVSVPMENLSAKIKSIFATRKNKEIYLQADKSVNYGVVAETMAEIREAGVYKIGLITIPKSK